LASWAGVEPSLSIPPFLVSCYFLSMPGSQGGHFIFLYSSARGTSYPVCLAKEYLVVIKVRGGCYKDTDSRLP
jgi:hypothetical protein